MLHFHQMADITSRLVGATPLTFCAIMHVMYVIPAADTPDDCEHCSHFCCS